MEVGLKPHKENDLSRDLVVVHGSDPAAITKAAIDALGGLEKLVSPGDIVVVKPNISFDRSPEYAATTNPDVVAAVVELAKGAGAAEVHVFDHTLYEARLTYKRSGIADAATKAGAKVSYVRGQNDRRFRDMAIPGGVVMTSWPLHDMLTKADVLINVPIAKHHDSTRLTLGMKNLMGLAGGNRGTWHRDMLVKRIADLNGAVKVDLTVLDAFRILVAHGPTGGSLDDVREPHKVIAGIDPIAVDSYAATLFDMKGEDIGYVREGHGRGLGELDLAKVSLRELSV
jgi:uncharacterized protein (DUF362 family)